MNDLPPAQPETSAAQEAELRELENELRRFRPAPLPPAVQQRMVIAARRSMKTTESIVAPPSVQKAYGRYIAPAAAMFMLVVVAYSLPQTPNTPTPLYVPLLACLAGLLMLTVRPHRRQSVLLNEPS